MSKVLTVVVPTYNVEKYIRQNLESFEVEEILEDLEVLIVSDGSQDGSVDIAREFADRHPDTFKIIEKENGGHGSTINRGIIEATGKYFKVVDADDWVLEEGLINLIKQLKSCDSDLVVSGFYWYHNDKDTTSVEIENPVPGTEYYKEYKVSDVCRDMYVKMHGMTVKTEILKKIPKIDEHCFYVDVEYVMFPIPLVETITSIPDYVYMYRIGIAGQSMDPAKMQRNQDNFDRVLERMFAFYTQCKKDGVDDAKMTYITNFLARVVASRFKIFLGFPYSRDIKKQMLEFDTRVKNEYPDIYYAIKQKAVLLLRKSKYNLYFLAQMVYKRSL